MIPIDKLRFQITFQVLGAISRRGIQVLTQISFRRREKLGKVVEENREPAESVNRKECRSENGETERLRRRGGRKVRCP